MTGDRASAVARNIPSFPLAATARGTTRGTNCGWLTNNLNSGGHSLTEQRWARSIDLAHLCSAIAAVYDAMKIEVAIYSPRLPILGVNSADF